LWCARDQPAGLARRAAAHALARCRRITLASLSRPNQQPPRARATSRCWITTCSALPISSASPAVDDLTVSIHRTTRLSRTQSTHHQLFHLTHLHHFLPPISISTKMPPKAQKTPTTGGKAPAGKAPAEKKEAGKKTAAPSGDKKKRTKTRKETYSSYIYKGEFAPLPCADNRC
jgi:hypothetical protein